MTSHAEQAILTVAGRDVPISNPRKVLFPQPGYTKLDLARYYIAVADGALRSAGGRPTVLVRYPDGIDGEFFYQKRAPRARPPWIDVVALRFPSGRSAEEVVPRDAATLAVMANLACLELHPHPARAGAGDEQVVERRAARRIPRLQPEREGSHDCERILGAPHAGGAGVCPADLGRDRYL